MKEIVVPKHTILWCEAELTATGETITDVVPLRVEASHRCFYRVQTERRSVVLMDSPPELERNEAFATLADVFQRHDIPVAAVLAREQSRGLFLLEDLGDAHLEDVYDTALEDEALQAAVDLLPRLAAIRHPAIEPYTRERLYMELDLFSEWFVGRWLELEVYTGVYQRCSEQLVAELDAQPKCCVHRDYHCRNLLYNSGTLGVVDYQDALHGPVMYDIASLLQDCYHTFSPDKTEHWLQYFVGINPQLQDLELSRITRWFDWTAIQRQLKAVGIFARLHLRDGKSTHLRHILPVLDRLQTATARYPEFAGLNVQLNRCIDYGAPRLAAYP